MNIYIVMPLDQQGVPIKNSPLGKIIISVTVTDYSTLVQFLHRIQAICAINNNI